MATIARLSVQIVANAQHLMTTLPKIGSAVSNAGSRISAVSTGIASFARGAAAQISSFLNAPLQSLEKLLKAVPLVGEALSLLPAAASAALGSLMDWFRRGASDILALNAQAVRLNTTIEDIEPILTLAGDSAESASKGLFHMQRVIADAAAGIPEAEKKLRGLGLSFADLAGKSTGQQFGIIADRLNGFQSAGEKASHGMDVFNKSTIELMKIISRGSVGLEEFRKKMEAEGGGTTTAQALMVKRAVIAMKTMERIFSNMRQSLAVVLSPIIEGVTRQFGGMALAQEKVQTWMFKLAKTAAVFGLILKNAFTPWRIMREGKALTAFFDEVRRKIQMGFTVGAREEGAGNFLQTFAEHAAELTVKLQEQTAAYGRNSNAIELNRLARERAAALGNVSSQIMRAPEEHKAKMEALRKQIQDVERQADAALDKYNWGKWRQLDARLSALRGLLESMEATSARAVASETEERRKNYLAAKKQADAIYQAAQARASELEMLDKITSSVAPSLNIYDEYRQRLFQLNAAFTAGRISAEGLQGGLLKIAEALEKAETGKAGELFKSALSPVESMQAKLAELNGMLSRGVISWEIYERSVYGAVRAVMDLHKAESLRMSGAAEFGSQEAYKIVNQNLLNSGRQKSGIESLKEAIKEQLQLQKQQKKDLDEIARAARAGFLAVGRI